MIWLKIGLAVFTVFAVVFLVKLLLRKIFHIDKEEREWFSYNYINDTHKKVDHAKRPLYLIFGLTIIYLYFYKDFSFIWYAVFLVAATVLDYSLRAFFEWKHSENPKQAILTISEMIVIATSFVAVFYFDVFNILP